MSKEKWIEWTAKEVADLTPSQFRDVAGMVALLSFLFVLMFLWSA